MKTLASTIARGVSCRGLLFVVPLAAFISISPVGAQEGADEGAGAAGEAEVAAPDTGAATGGGMMDTMKGAASVGVGTAADAAARGADMDTAGKQGAAAAVNEAMGTNKPAAPAMPNAGDVSGAAKGAAQDAADNAADDAADSAAEAAKKGIGGAMGGYGNE